MFVRQDAERGAGSCSGPKMAKKAQRKNTKGPYFWPARVPNRRLNFNLPFEVRSAVSSWPRPLSPERNRPRARGSLMSAVQKFSAITPVRVCFR